MDHVILFFLPGIRFWRFIHVDSVRSSLSLLTVVYSFYEYVIHCSCVVPSSLQKIMQHSYMYHVQMWDFFLAYIYREVELLCHRIGVFNLIDIAKVLTKVIVWFTLPVEVYKSYFLFLPTSLPLLSSLGYFILPDSRMWNSSSLF